MDEPDPEVLAPPPTESLPANLAGQWRIRWMELWEQVDVEAMGPGLIRLERDGTGDLTFLCVQAWLDCEAVERDGKEAVDFSWEGDDDGDHRCGRGWLRLGDTGDTVEGRIFFHRGDSSAFKAERVVQDSAPIRGRARRRRK